MPWTNAKTMPLPNIALSGCKRGLWTIPYNRVTFQDRCAAIKSGFYLYSRLHGEEMNGTQTSLLGFWPTKQLLLLVLFPGLPFVHGPLVFPLSVLLGWCLSLYSLKLMLSSAMLLPGVASRPEKHLISCRSNGRMEIGIPAHEFTCFSASPCYFLILQILYSNVFWRLRGKRARNWISECRKY